MARDTGREDGAKGTAEEVRGRIKEAVAGLTGDCEVIAPVGAPIAALRWRSSPLPFITGLGLVPPLASAVATALPSALDVLDVHEVTANRADMGLGAVQPTGDHTVRESSTYEPQAPPRWCSPYRPAWPRSSMRPRRRSIRSFASNARQATPTEPR